MSDGLNVTDQVPPICTRHSELMVLSFYDRPGSPLGNGYVCRSCAKERATKSEAIDGTAKEFVRRMTWEQGMNVDHDPAKSLLKPLPPSEKAELQASLLNEIGLTLTAVAKQAKADGVIAGQRYGALLDWSEANGKGLSNLFELMAEQAETLKTYKLSLEGIQGLLVDLAHSLDVVGAPLAMRLAQIELRISHIGAQLTVFAQEKPRKAGKRPAHKTKVTHKTR